MNCGWHMLRVQVQASPVFRLLYKAKCPRQMLRYTLPAACPLSLLRADNSPHLTAVRSVEAVPDDPAADSLDRADAGADSSGDQYRCKKFHSDVSFIPRGSAAP